MEEEWRRDKAKEQAEELDDKMEEDGREMMERFRGTED